MVRERSCVQSTPAAPNPRLKSLAFCTTQLSCVVLHRAERCSNMRARWHAFDTRCSGDVSLTLLRPILIGQRADHPTEPKRPVVLFGRAAFAFCCLAERAVSWIAHTPQWRNGGTTSPSTAPGRFEDAGLACAPLRALLFPRTTEAPAPARASALCQFVDSRLSFVVSHLPSFQAEGETGAR